MDKQVKIIKRSVSIAGHSTSVSIEEPFWLALKDIAKKQKLSLNALITQIDSGHPNNLSSAIRCYVLRYYTS